MADKVRTPAHTEETITGHAPASPESLQASEAPKPKRKYSKNTRAMQEVERGMNKAAAQMADAVAATFNTYKKRSNDSSFKKRDGAVKDAVKNWTKAYSEGMKEASDVPYKFVKSVSRGKAGKQFRDAVRMFSPPMFR